MPVGKDENETFNTLKNQGYAFGHNFGHGDKYLSTVLAHLMMLAFNAPLAARIDQIQQRCCAVFRRARARARCPKYLWERMRAAGGAGLGHVLRGRREGPDVRVGGNCCGPSLTLDLDTLTCWRS